MRVIFVWALVIALVLSVGCGQSTMRPRLADTGPNPGYIPAGEEALLQGQAALQRFSMELFAEMAAAGKENVLISPLSAYLVLSMAAGGAAGQTEVAFDRILGLTKAARNGYCLALTERLASKRGSTALSLANAVWVNEGLKVQKGYLEMLEQAYAADMFQADLASKGTMQAMNRFVRAKTKGMIPRFFAEPLQGDNLVMVLINAMYLSAKWEYPMDVHTYVGEFRLSDTQSVQVDFIQGRAQALTYIDKEGVQGVLLPYDDGRLAFLGLMPVAGTSVRELAQSLPQTPLQEYLSAGEERNVLAILPKFSVEYGTSSMRDVLCDMGLSVAFEADGAEFPSLVVEEAGLGPIYISDVLQKVRLNVHELGTEAAAATAAVMEAGGAQETILMEFDRPFLYAIVDMESGLPLFMGMMENPA